MSRRRIVRSKSWAVAGLALLVFSASLVTAALSIAHPAQVDQFGAPGSGAGELASPGGIAVDPDTGSVFVADTANNRISIFDSEGNFLRAFGWGVETGAAKLEVCTTSCQAGSAGPGNGQLSTPIGVAVSPKSGDLYTLSLEDGRVQEFTATGGFVRSFGGLDENDPTKFGSIRAENGIAVNSAGNVYVANNGRENRGRISVFSAAGTYLRQLTVDNPLNSFQFTPGSLAFDSKDQLYVVDSNFYVEKVKVFDSNGVFLRKQAEAPAEAIREITVDPTTDHSFITIASSTEFESSYTLREFDAAGKPIESTQVYGLAPFEYGGGSVGLAYDPSASFPGSRLGAFYLVDRAGGSVFVEAQPAVVPPTLENVVAGGIGSTFADIGGDINTNGSATNYFVEYGPTSGYGSSAPAPPGGVLPALYDPQHVGVRIAGLTPGTTYHYSLVAVNSAGRSASPDRLFTTVASTGGIAASLPDGRAYELVSPVDKNFGGVSPNEGTPVNFADPKGGAVTVVTFNPLPGAESGAAGTYSVSRRGPSGWEVTPLTPATTNNKGGVSFIPPFLISRDLSQSVFGLPVDPTGEVGNDGQNHLYLRSGFPPSYRVLNRATPTGAPEYIPIGASADFKHLFFEATAVLSPDVPTPPSGNNRQVYEYFDGTFRPVGILPGETIASAEGAISSDSYKALPNIVSEDGSRVVFNSPNNAFSGGGPPPPLYVRVDGTRTVAISGPQLSAPGSPTEPQGATYLDAASDGSAYFFSSAAKLTDDATPGPAGQDLYRYDFDTGKLLDLSVDDNPEDPNGAVVEGAVASRDGDTVYFTAKGALRPGAVSGSANLYRWSESGGLDFIATGIYPTYSRGTESAMVTANGDTLLFGAPSSLLDPSASEAPAIWRYSVAGNRLECVSCAPIGTTNLIGSFLRVEPANRLPRLDGHRVFFDTPDALLPGDVNGARDVYEWQDGRLALISSGRDTYDSSLDSSSASGDDVYFFTRERLVGRDVDDAYDIYDARVGGGFPEPAAETRCEGGACRPDEATPPPPSTAGSANFVGPPNRKARRKSGRCRVVKSKKSHGKKVRRCTRKHPKKHGRKHGRKSSGGKRR